MLDPQRIGDITDLLIGTFHGLAFSNNNEGVHTLHSALPLVEEADLLVQVGFESVDDLDILVDGLAVSIADDGDQEVGQNQENEK